MAQQLHKWHEIIFRVNQPIVSEPQVKHITKQFFIIKDSEVFKYLEYYKYLIAHPFIRLPKIRTSQMVIRLLLISGFYEACRLQPTDHDRVLVNCGVISQHYILLNPFIHLGGDGRKETYESKVSCLRTQHIACQGSNILSRAY